MFIPLWALVGAVLLLAANLALDLVRFFRSRRRADQRAPTPPRPARG